MSPSALAERLLGDQKHGPMVDAIINGRGLTPPSESVHRIWLVEQMVPFNRHLCRSHVFEIEMENSDPAAKPWSQPVPTHPATIEQYDRLWVPPTAPATPAVCAAAPAQTSGFHDGGLGLESASDLVEQARMAFHSNNLRSFTVSCRGERGACGKDPRKTLSLIDWSALGEVEKVTPRGEPYSVGDSIPKDAPWGPSNVQFTFPYAAAGATWVITVRRSPKIVAVRMEADTIVYH